MSALLKKQPRPGALRCVWPDDYESSLKLGARIMRYELTEHEWAAIKLTLPNKLCGTPGVTTVYTQRHFLRPSIWSSLARSAG
jgi:hypothetical protein